MASSKIVLSNSLPLGFRFHPTDEEIVSHFLKNKMLGNDNLVGCIPEVDLCRYEPWELPNFSLVESDDPEWFFFSTRDFKYSHGRRMNRATRDGFWKATGKDVKIKARTTKKWIGTKKIFVYHKGRVPNGVKTNWVMHEYHSVDNYHPRAVYVVCRLKKKDDEKVDNVDSDLQSRKIESAVPEVWPEDYENLLFTPPLQQANGELVCPSGNWEIDDEFINSLIVNGEEHYGEETDDRFNNLFMQSTGSTSLEGAMFSRDTDLEATEPWQLGREELAPNSSAISESSSCSVQPKIRTTRKSEGRMFPSKRLQYEQQDNIYFCNEFPGSDISGEFTVETDARLKKRFPETESEESHINPLRRIRLQRRFGPAAVNLIKAEEPSKSTSGDRTRPPSEYFANVIVGIVLIAVFVREMVLFGEWGI